jgi:hypothetical protein
MMYKIDESMAGKSKILHTGDTLTITFPPLQDVKLKGTMLGPNQIEVPIDADSPIGQYNWTYEGSTGDIYTTAKDIHGYPHKIYLKNLLEVKEPPPLWEQV